MRSFLTRLVNSVTRVVPVAPCLLICLACATPFPIESLEEGMTTETVRESFGEPEAIETKPGGVDLSWSYVHEEQDWIVTFHPLAPLIIPFTLAVGDGWKGPYVIRKPVVLHFEAEKLVRWEVIEPTYAFGDNWVDVGDFDSLSEFPTKDSIHHDMEHEHHHGHD